MERDSQDPSSLPSHSDLSVFSSCPYALSAGTRALPGVKKRQTESDRLATTYNEGSLVRLGAQRIVVFEALILHVDSSAHPMHVILIDREDDDI